MPPGADRPPATPLLSGCSLLGPFLSSFSAWFFTQEIFFCGLETLNQTAWFLAQSQAPVISSVRSSVRYYGSFSSFCAWLFIWGPFFVLGQSFFFFLFFFGLETLNQTSVLAPPQAPHFFNKFHISSVPSVLSLSAVPPEGVPAFRYSVKRRQQTSTRRETEIQLLRATGIDILTASPSWSSCGKKVEEQE